MPFLHSILSACADLLFVLYVKRFYGLNIAYKASLCRIISWFTVYMCTRSLTNTIEEIFTIFSLAALQQASSLNKTNTNSYWWFHLCGFFSFVIRSTSAINLIPIYTLQFFYLCKTSYSKCKFTAQFILVG